MAYNPKTWKDDKVGQTPIKAEDLNHIEQGIANAVEKNTDALLTNVVSRNLLGMNNYSYVIWNLNSGATVTAGKENLKITTSGKAYSGIFGKLCQFANLDENKTYTVSFDAKASVNVNLQYGITSNSRQIAITSQTKRISLQETGKNLKNTNFQFYCLSTVVCTITIENIMIDEGNVATLYAPYLNLQELQDNSNTISIAPSTIFDSTKLASIGNTNKNEVSLINNIVIINYSALIKVDLEANTFLDIGKMNNLPITPNKNIIFTVIDSTKMILGMGYYQLSSGNIRVKFANKIFTNDEIFISAIYTLN